MARFQSTLWTLIGHARGGDERALTEFVARYRPPVVAFLGRRGLGSEAEDLAQEVFLQVFKDEVLTKADPDQGRFRSLLLAVTRNVIGKHFRHHGAKKRGAGNVQLLGSAEVAAPNDDEEFDKEWSAHLVKLAMERLDKEHPQYHDAVKRFVFGGATYEEIIAATGTTKGSLKNRINRGKLKLAGYIRDEVRAYAASHEEYAAELGHFARFFGLGGQE